MEGIVFLDRWYVTVVWEKAEGSEITDTLVRHYHVCVFITEGSDVMETL